MVRPSDRAVTALRYVSMVLFGALVVVMAYGFYTFPAAPIRYVHRQYVDKRGQIHTRDEFERLHVWERIFVASWIASAISGVSYQYVKRQQRRT